MNPEAGGPATGLWWPYVEPGADSTMVWLHRPGRTAVQLEKTKPRSEFKVGWNRRWGRRWLGLGTSHRQG